MITRRFFLALFAFTLLLPLSGCGCRRHCCGDDRRSNAPPQGCCDKAPPPGFIPGVQP